MTSAERDALKRAIDARRRALNELPPLEIAQARTWSPGDQDRAYRRDYYARNAERIRERDRIYRVEYRARPEVKERLKAQRREASRRRREREQRARDQQIAA